MSGGYEAPDLRGYKDETGKAPEVMKKFNVDEETAGRIIDWAVQYASDKMNKWTSNMRRIQKEKAEVIYQLTRRLKREGKGNMTVINEIEKKILEMCIET